MPDLGQMIEAEIQRMQKLSPRVVPLQAPDAPLGGVIERMVNAALPQTIRDFDARQAANTELEHSRKAEQRRNPFDGGFSGEFPYEKSDPGF
jgi:hypothetical protein